MEGDRAKREGVDAAPTTVVATRQLECGCPAARPLPAFRRGRAPRGEFLDVPFAEAGTLPPLPDGGLHLNVQALDPAAQNATEDALQGR